MQVFQLIQQIKNLTMDFKNISIIVISLLMFSCAENQKNQKSSEAPIIEGYWNRIGTIQLVNGIPVDTMLIKNSDNTDFKQVKVFEDGNMIEYGEFGSWRGSVNNNTPRNAANAHYASVTFYDNDMYQQITKDTLKQTWRQDKERGVVDKRVQ